MATQLATSPLDFVDVTEQQYDTATRTLSGTEGIIHGVNDTAIQLFMPPDQRHVIEDVETIPGQFVYRIFSDAPIRITMNFTLANATTLKTRFNTSPPTDFSNGTPGAQAPFVADTPRDLVFSMDNPENLSLIHI